MLRRSYLLLLIVLVLGLLTACGTPQAVEDVEDSAEVEVVEQSDEEIGVNEEQEPTPTVVPTPTVAAPALTEGPAKAVYSVGDTARLDAFLVRVDDIQLVGETAYGKPTEGNQFLQVNVSLENTSDESQSISPLLQMRVVDAAGKEFPLDVDAGINFLALNGAINPGELATGTVGYEVPVDAKNLQWAFVTVDSESTQVMKEKGRIVFSGTK